MFTVLGWLIYGFVVGVIAKHIIHPDEGPVGCLPTIGIGVAGSFFGGFINFILGFGSSPFGASGILMGILGGVIFCWIYKEIRKKL